MELGSAWPLRQELQAEVRGRDLVTGLPKTVVTSTLEIREAIEEPVASIVDAVKVTLDKTPPELAADIVDRGIMLAGGGAQVRGITDLISHETGILTHVAEDPLLCVVNGCGIVLEDYKRLERVLDTPDFARQTV